MAYRYDYRFDETYDLPLNGKMAKTKNELVYRFDKSCINPNYSYKIGYDAFYEYCYKMAHFIAQCTGLEDDISDCLHDYFTFYLSNAGYEYPTIRICMTIPGENVNFVFTFDEKSSRNHYNYESNNDDNNFYDLNYIHIYIDGKSEDIDYVKYENIEGFDEKKLEYFCNCCGESYNDYSYVLLNDINKKH